MKRIVRQRAAGLTALLLALLVLSGCGGGSDKSESSVAQNTNGSMADIQPMEPAAAPELGGGWDMVTTDEMPRDTTQALPGQEKMIYTAELEMETREFDEAAAALDRIVEDLGGWYENRQLNEGRRYRSLSGVVRVPVERLEELLDQAGEEAHVTGRYENREDVSEIYYDSEARLTTQRTKLERLQTLLGQAESMEDIIALESAISETELLIESLTGSLRRYDSLIAYSTVTVHLQEVYRLSEDEAVPQTFWQRVGSALGDGWQRGVERLEDMVILAAGNWLSLLLTAAVVAAVVLAFRRHRKKRKERKAAEKREAEQKEAAEQKETKV